MEIYFSVLMERSIQDQAATALFDLMRRAGFRGFKYIRLPYAHTVSARNAITEHFLKKTKNDNDLLVMLDCDHAHPFDIIDRLAAHNLPVVSALAYRRSYPYDPQIYKDIPGVGYRQPSNPGEGLQEVDATGFAAVAIRRHVFFDIEKAGRPKPWFRIGFSDGELSLVGEDMYFCESCRRAGIPLYCDTSIMTPHLALEKIDGSQWQRLLAEGKADGNGDE